VSEAKRGLETCRLCRPPKRSEGPRSHYALCLYWSIRCLSSGSTTGFHGLSGRTSVCTSSVCTREMPACGYEGAYGDTSFERERHRLRAYGRWHEVTPRMHVTFSPCFSTESGCEAPVQLSRRRPSRRPEYSCRSMGSSRACRISRGGAVTPLAALWGSCAPACEAVSDTSLVTSRALRHLKSVRSPRRSQRGSVRRRLGRCDSSRPALRRLVVTGRFISCGSPPWRHRSSRRSRRGAPD
jgi:hypothetical protein